MRKNSQYFNTITQGDTATILLYGEVGCVRGVDPKVVVTELMTLAATYKQIDIRINSIGGDVFAGIAIYNAIKSSTAKITLYVDGLAASMAGVIALCGKPLYMSKHAKLMLHNVSGGAYGSAAEMRETADLIDNLESDLAAIIAGRLGMSTDTVRATYFDGKDHWLTAQQAQELGLIDGLFDGTAPEGVTAESSIDELYIAFSNRLQAQAQPNNNDMGLLEEIKTIPSLANVAGEGEAVARIRTMATATAKVEELQEVINRQKQRIEDLEAQELKTILDNAVAEKKITEAQRPTYEALLKSDKENTLALLGSLTSSRKKEMAQDWIDQDTPSNEFAGKTWTELDKAGLLSKLKATNKTLFAQLYKKEYGIEYND